MTFKRTLQFAAAVLAVVLGGAATAFAASPVGNSLVIRHEVRGCHSWSLNGGKVNPNQALTTSVKSTVTIVNNDLMPHTLVQLSGPAAQVKTTAGWYAMGSMMGSATTATMNHMGATSQVTFPKKGVYVFKTNAGDDYPIFKNVKTLGEDNVLRLVVRVS